MAFSAEGVRDCGNGVHAISVSSSGACVAGILRQGKRLLRGPLPGPQGEMCSVEPVVVIALVPCLNENVMEDRHTTSVKRIFLALGPK